MRVERYPENPLITPRDVKPSLPGWDVLCTFNAGVIEYEGEILMLMRVAERPASKDPNRVLVPVLRGEEGAARLEILEFSANEPTAVIDSGSIHFPDRTYLTTISHLRLARSKDGRHFTIDPEPALFPDQLYEAFGIEDPRITRIGDTYYVVYKGVSGTGILQCLASTKDFVTWEKHGIIFCPENMDGMLFPEKIRGKYAALHRPSPKYMGHPNMWIAYSDDLIHWGEHEFLIGASVGSWESGRIGGGAVPFLTDRGWLEIYHATIEDNKYCLGAALLDKDYPEILMAKSPEPMIRPETPYEREGFVPNVIFTCGAIVRGDTVSVYYGAADTVMAGADFSLREILDSLESV